MVNRTFIKSDARILITKQDPRIPDLKKWLKKNMYVSLWTVNTDPISQLQNARNYSLTFVYTCESEFFIFCENKSHKLWFFIALDKAISAICSLSK